MRLPILALVCIALAATAANACPELPRLYIVSPFDRDLPLRGSIFVANWGAPLFVRWADRTGISTVRNVSWQFARIDYEVDGDATLLVTRDERGIGARPFTVSSSARVRAPRTASLSRTDNGHCNTVRLELDEPVAALRVRVTQPGGVEDRWLVEPSGPLWTQPICASRAGPTVLQLYAVLADGREQRIGGPVDFAQIPVRELHFWDDDDEGDSPIDVTHACAWILAIAALLASGAARPRVAVHGVASRHYLPDVRFRIRLPRAHVIARRS